MTHPLRKPVPVVRSRVVDVRTLRNDPERVDAMVVVVVHLDPFRVYRDANVGDPENVLSVVEDVRILM
ncbi:hypothetical protein SASPL_157405 [Salvia splendens]|uniref:Uncharacterized protein n=1 Tax=Salvia splendens TaxID=180675 RepID=A0A8X8VV49_SALSN|nr:hypothetical protein SASPL_157405 [Salvia splendens]